MSVVSMKSLLEAGVHFGHQTRRWNPKMARYIFAERNGIYIIDLQKTVKMINQAYNFLRDTARSGKRILFVGTKKQAQETIREEANRCEQFYVNQRWLGGMLTNFATIRRRVDYLKRLESEKLDGTLKLRPKKEAAKLEKERVKLEKYLGGIKEMKELPGALFVIDPKKEHIAVVEARKLKIPIVSVVDTNCDPDEVDYVIPGNDDAIRAIKLLTVTMANAVVEGRSGSETPEAAPADAAPSAPLPGTPVRSKAADAAEEALEAETAARK